jgi:hypothetical protein
MIIDAVHILSDDKNPEYFLNPDGNIKIKGRGVAATVTEVPFQIMNWIDEYLVNPAEITTVILALDYLNSYSLINLVSILRKLSQVNKQSKKLVIKWYYEDVEDDILYQGESVSSTFNIPFEFIMTNNITNI